MRTSEASGIIPTGWRILPLSGVLLLAALSLVWPVGSTQATEPAPPPLAGVGFIDAWTNDGGSVDDADTNDVGDVNETFDAWGTDSSDDPSAEGLDLPRYDKDVALCSATVRGADPSYVDVTVVNGYPGYVCTFAVTFENGTAVPASVVPAVIAFDPGLDVSQITPLALPSLLGPGDQATGLFAVRIEESAPQDSTLTFSITLVISGEDAGCQPLTEADIPPGAILDGAVLVNDSGLCTFFFHAKPGPCGPGWNADNPFAWHFVVNKTGGATGGTLTAVFLSAPDIVDIDPDQITRNTLQFYVYTPTADTLVGAYVVLLDGDPTRAQLVLSHTCNDPNTSDLALVVSSDTDGEGTVSFTFVLANHGAAPVADVTVSRWLSEGLTVESVTATAGTLSSGDLWEIPFLGASESAVLTIIASADEPGVYEAIGEVVAVAGLDFDSVPGNGAVDEDDFARATARVLFGAPTEPGAGTWLLLGLLLMVLLAVVATNRRPAVLKR